MKYIVNNTDGQPIYAIEPYQGETCWKILEYREIDEKKRGVKTGRKGRQWVETGKYPTSLSYAFQIILEKMAMRNDVDVVGFKNMTAQFKRIQTELLKAVENAK